MQSDQMVLRLNKEQFAALIRALNNPPPPNEKLRQLLAAKAPWEK